MFGRSKKKEFRAIKERLWSHIKSWGSRVLSRAGKAVLIQSMAQAIPLFVMNCFKLPMGFLHELNMLMAGYWWGVTQVARRRFIGEIGRLYVVLKWIEG